jgi:threonine dehydratase
MTGTSNTSLAELPVTLGDVEAAAGVLDGFVKRTVFDRSRTLSDITGAELWLKFENLQFTATFKERGALNRLSALSAAERARGVIAASAGNHAQGVAYHAARLAIPATIFVPRGTPTVKIENTRRHGATVTEAGATLEEAAALAVAHGREHRLTFIHPYDDPLIIAGQGTIALEMLDKAPGLDTLIVPIGGGGLISGIAIAAKALRPTIEVIGVQSALYPAMAEALKGKPPDTAVAGATLAEGIAVKEPGALTRQIVAALVADILLVEDVQIEGAIEHLIDREKLVAEGAGAAGVAALLSAPERFRGRRVGIVITGGNIDARLLASVLMRGLVREGRLVRLRSELPDVPGALARLSGVIGGRGGNIVEVHHQRLFQDSSVKRAELDVVVETQNRRHVAAIVAALIAAGFPTELLSTSSDRIVATVP